MFEFIGFVVIAALLWAVVRNTGETLDKQAALHFEISQLNRRLKALSPDTAESPAPDIAKVNVNLATQADLEALPGIGKALAAKIIDARPFSTLTDLEAVSGVSKDLLSKLEDKLSL